MNTDLFIFLIWFQVSHHPPVSAFYVTNRQDGFCISASILAKSKFYGMGNKCKYLNPCMPTCLLYTCLSKTLYVIFRQLYFSNSRWCGFAYPIASW